MVEVVTFTPRAPVNLFERSRQSVGTTFEGILAPVFYAEVNPSGQVQSLKTSTAVISAISLSNTSAQTRRVDFQVRSARRITYQAEVVAQAGQNWLRIDRVTRALGVSIFGYDWTQTPPVRLTQAPAQTSSILTDLGWRPDGRYVVATENGPRFRVYDKDNAFALVYSSPPAATPVRTQRCAWSPDGRYLAVVYDRAEFADNVFLRVFDFDAGIAAPVEVAVPDVTARVTRFANGVSWGGPDGRYLVLANTGQARFAVWDWATGNPIYSATLTSALSNATAGTGVAVAFSPDTNNPRLAVSHTGGDRLTVFEWSSPTTPVKVADSIFAENSTSRTPPSRGLAWSQDGTRLAALSSDSVQTPYTAYTFFGGLSRLPTPPAPPPLPTLTTLAWSPDNRYVVLGHDEGARYTYYPVSLSYLLLYDYQSGFPVRVTSAPRLQGFGSVRRALFSPDGGVLMVAGWSYDRNYPPTGVDNVRLFDGSGENVVVNGSFEDTTGMTRTDFGFTAPGQLVGWFADAQVEPLEDVTLFFPNRRFVNAFATEGSVYLDIVSSSLNPLGPNDARLRQNFESLTEGETYRLAVDITASIDSEIGVRFLWNGTPITIAGETDLPIFENLSLVSVDVPPGETVQAPLARAMLAYGDDLQVKANGAGVDCVVSYVLSTQEVFATITSPPPPPDPE
jgi:WD40 repeat protein